MLEFIEELKRSFEGCKQEDPLQAWRQKGWDHAHALGLPDKSHQAFQYVPLRAFYAQDVNAALTQSAVQSASYPECKGASIVFVDGVLRKDLSDLSALPPSIVLLPLTDAFSKYGPILKARFTASLAEEKDPFAALNLALHSEGAFLFIPPGLELKTPIQCLHYSSVKRAHPRLHLFVGARSSVKWIHSAQGHSSLWHNSYIDVSLEEGSRFHAVNLILPEQESWHFETLRATVKKDATFRSVSVTCGAKTVRQDYRVALVGTGASAELQGIAMLQGAAHSHVHVHVDHQAPHTTSSQLFKGALNQSSHSSFEGKIYVHAEAQKTQAYQLNNHLILSEGSVANAKPNLEIFADDVKASHGATVAQIDPAQLFYLQTRGIDSDLAKHLLVSSFCQEILTQIPHLSIAQEMQNMLKKYLQF